MVVHRDIGGLKTSIKCCAPVRHKSLGIHFWDLLVSGLEMILGLACRVVSMEYGTLAILNTYEEVQGVHRVRL